MGWDQDMEQAVERAVAAAGEAVVTVGRGSGVVVADDRVVTNAHNLSGQVRVRFADGQEAIARVAGADLVGDLAVVEVEAAGLAPVHLAPDAARLGQAVVAMARPRNRGLTATVGTVAAVDAAFRGPRGSVITGAFEHDARLPRRASGGPLLDTTGRLLGINTHRRQDGFYVSVPTTDDFAGRIEQLAEGVVPARPRLGVTVAPPFVARRLRAAVGLPEREGVLVREVEEGGPAAGAGVDAGDLIVAVDGVPVGGVDDLQAALAGADGPIELTIVRGSDERTVTVDLASA